MIIALAVTNDGATADTAPPGRTEDATLLESAAGNAALTALSARATRYIDQ
jgi:hypothetical protein